MSKYARLEQARLHRQTLRTELPEPVPSEPDPAAIAVVLALGALLLLGAGYVAWKAGKAAWTGGRALVALVRPGLRA